MHPVSQMKLLISLAQADGKVAEREKNYIINIGRANGIFPDEVTAMLEKNHEVIVPTDLTADQKFDYIYSLVQLMKIDERMYQEEIRFCSTIAVKLGYKQEVLFELMLYVKSTGQAPHEVQKLRQITSNFLHG